MDRKRFREAFGSLTNYSGAATDFGSTILQWQRNRVPRYKGLPIGEAERPSVSYMVDVC